VQGVAANFQELFYYEAYQVTLIRLLLRQNNACACFNLCRLQSQKWCQFCQSCSKYKRCVFI